MKKYRNKDWLHQKYWKEKLTLRQIASLCNITDETVFYWMQKFRIPRRTKSEAGKEFNKKNPGYFSGKNCSKWNGGESCAWARKMWKKYWGRPIPKEFDIHHADGNKKNNKISNLVPLEHWEHASLHKRNMVAVLEEGK